MSKIYAVALDGEAVEISNATGFRTLNAEGELVQHLPGALESYIAEGALEEKGIAELEEPETPEGQVVTLRNLILEAGVPVLDIEFGPPPAPAVEPEVAMHRAHKAMMLTPWGPARNFGAEGRDLYDAALEAMGELPSPSNKLARAEFLRAPNIVRAGDTTANVAALLGMTEEEVDGLFLLAATLP